MKDAASMDRVSSRGGAGIQKSKPTTKLFVTGCPRSGTTLVQSILAQAAGLYTLKETHFFLHLMRRRPLRWVDRYFRLDPTRVAASFNFIKAHNGIEIPDDLGRVRHFGEACILFDRMLSGAATARGFSGWLEKTPEHMFFTDDIRGHIPEARFVHILRDGPDVVASLIDARRKYPESWNWIGDLSSTVRLYNRYARTLRQEVNRPDSFILRYDDLIKRDPVCLARLCVFLAIPPSALNLDKTTTCKPDIVRQDEPWKIRSDQGIVNTQGQKFGNIFTEQEQHFIHRNLQSTLDITSG